MSQILDRLWCGDFEDGYREVHKRPHEWQVQHILNVSQTPYYAPYEQAVHFHIHDELFLSPDTWTQGTELIHKLLFQWERTQQSPSSSVLVHCRLGKSRAPALCAAYLIRCGHDPVAALDLVRSRRPVADPHPETWRSVIAWSKGERR